MNKMEERYDVVVVGGGMAGVCAAIAAARHGCKTGLVHDRPVLGGNASSEIRVGIEGAEFEFRHARETGILEEIQTEDRKRNYHRSINGAVNYVFDTILLEWVNREKNLSLHLNTSVFKADRQGNTIESIHGLQSGSENLYRIQADVFIDTSGDGVLAELSGAEFRIGREGKNEFGESIAPDKPDNYTMGSSLLFHVVDRGRLVKFTPPEWAHKFPRDEDIWDHNYGWGHRGPYVWVEAGGEHLNTIHDNEKIMDELRKILYGVWDHIKNHGNHHAENLEIDWVGSIPGKRESRRIMGDYILKEGDIQKREMFADRVAYGGWPFDVHNVGGFRAPKEGGASAVPLTSGLYSIPFRCFYSKNIENLMMAGRNISVSHVALGSTRIIATCAVSGQAVGTAASLCRKHKVKPKKVGQKYIRELQQILLKDDCYLIRMPHQDEKDIALKAKTSASSSMKLEVAEGAYDYELNIERAQKIVVTGNRLNSIKLKLENRDSEEKTVRLSIIRADFDDNICGESTVKDFGHLAAISREPGGFKYPDVLVSGESRLIPGKAQWVDFKLNATLEPEAYWVLLPVGKTCKGVRWQASDAVVPGLAAIYNTPGVGWSYSRKHVFLFQLEPDSYPFGPENVNNGISRPEDLPNIWISDPSREMPQYVELDFGETKEFNTIHITFDTNLDKFLRTSGSYAECVRDYEVLVRYGDEWKRVVKEQNNYMRKRFHSFNSVRADKVRLIVHRTNGVPEARIYEIRVYDEKTSNKCWNKKE